MTNYVLLGLTKRRAELTGEADTLRARLAQIGVDVGHIDAVIRQFDPEYDIASIRPKGSEGFNRIGSCWKNESYPRVMLLRPIS